MLHSITIHIWSNPTCEFDSASIGTIFDILCLFYRKCV